MKMMRPILLAVAVSLKLATIRLMIKFEGRPVANGT